MKEPMLMRRDYVLNKLAVTLADFSQTELRQLRTLLAEQSVIDTLSALIEKSLALRDLERGILGRSGPVEPDFRASKKEARGNASSAEGGEPFRGGTLEVRETLERALNDRSLFASTREVVEVVNSLFGCKLAYEDFRRNGRKPVIRKAWKLLSQRSPIQQGKALETLLGWLPRSYGERDEYRNLFRMLVGHESHSK